MRWTSRLTVRQAEGDRFLFRRRAPAVIDPSFGDPRLAAIRAAALEGAGRWPLIRGHLRAATGDAEDLTFLVAGLHTVAGVERWIGEVAAAEPGDPLPLLVSGARHVGWARHARPPLSGGQVSQERQEVFRARLEIAEEQLLAAAEAAPHWATPWYFLQVSGRGLGAGAEIAERRFEAVRSRSPFDAAGHRERLRQLLPEWGGTHEEARDFARRSTLAAPAGSPLGELVATTCLEGWRERGADPDSVFMTRPEVLRDLHEAADRSVRHQDFVRRRDWTLSFNTFAMAFVLSGDHASARRMFAVLGRQATEFPWQYLDDRSPLVPFLEWRARVSH
ncbi:MAG: hypothetical protein FWE15_19750 [Actinomycetia bacterium]|nr:hypothetical protein [Actinomycetes bacterium]